MKKKQKTISMSMPIRMVHVILWQIGAIMGYSISKQTN